MDARYQRTTTRPPAPAAPLYGVALFAPVPAPDAPPPGNTPGSPQVPLFCAPAIGAAPPSPPWLRRPACPAEPPRLTSPPTPTPDGVAPFCGLATLANGLRLPPVALT